jgi:hypothetical protein
MISVLISHLEKGTTVIYNDFESRNDKICNISSQENSVIQREQISFSK